MESASEAREERLARNEVLFRAVNEKLEQKAISFGGIAGYQFFCECSAVDCLDKISLTILEYEAVRSEGVRFFVTPGHEDDAIEFVVATNSRFSTIEKDGPAGIIAEFENPRDGDEPIH
jgi:hypothetical protein